MTATLELGRLDEAEAALAEIDEERWRDTAYTAFVYGAQARIAGARGSLDEALAAWRRCGSYAVERLHAANPTLLPWRSEAAVLAVRTGQEALALELATDDVARAERLAPRARSARPAERSDSRRAGRPGSPCSSPRCSA